MMGVGQEAPEQDWRFLPPVLALPEKMGDALSAQLPQNPAALHNSDPERGREHWGIHRHIRAAKESVSMQTLSRTDTRTPTVTPPLLADTTLNQSLAPSDLQWLGERLRDAYGPVEAPLPARLTELVERLARHEIPRE